MTMLLAMMTVMGAGAIDIGNFEQSIKFGDFRHDIGSMGVVVDMAIDAEGKPVRCAMGQVVGNKKLAVEACPVLMRKHYKPAHRANGEAAWYMVRDWVRAIEVGSREGDLVMRNGLAPDLDARVNALPGGQTSMTGLLLVDIDERGKARDCAVQSKEPAFPTSLCDNLDLLGQPVQRDRAGQPVGYITRLRVRLTTGPAAAPKPAN